MELEDIKIGMKVVPFKKTLGPTTFKRAFSPLDKYMVVEKIRQDGLVKLREHDSIITFNFAKDDFYPYMEGNGYINQVAIMLGVRIGEEFNIDKYSSSNPFHFTKECLVSSNDCIDNIALSGLILGTIKIEKITPYAEPIECVDGEEYKFISIAGKVYGSVFESTSTYDHMAKSIGNMFPVDAIIPQAQIDDMVKKLKGEL